MFNNVSRFSNKCIKNLKRFYFLINKVATVTGPCISNRIPNLQVHYLPTGGLHGNDRSVNPGKEPRSQQPRSPATQPAAPRPAATQPAAPRQQPRSHRSLCVAIKFKPPPPTSACSTESAYERQPAVETTISPTQHCLPFSM